MYAKSLHSCPTLCNPLDCSLPGSSVHGILQARILEWVAVASYRGSFRPRDRTHMSHIGRQVLLPLAPPGKPSKSAQIPFYEGAQYFLIDTCGVSTTWSTAPFPWCPSEHSAHGAVVHIADPLQTSGLLPSCVLLLPMLLLSLFYIFMWFGPLALGPLPLKASHLPLLYLTTLPSNATPLHGSCKEFIIWRNVAMCTFSAYLQTHVYWESWTLFYKPPLCLTLGSLEPDSKL